MARHRAAQSGAGFFNPFPRYLQIRHILIRRLSEGFAPGDRFPTEQELCSEFDVSRETVREALLGLERHGFIARRRGSGTVVVRLPEKARDERLTGLVEDYTELKLNTDVDVIQAGVDRPPARVAAALELERGEQLFRILRLRRIDGAPFACHDAFLPESIGAELAKLDLTHTTLFRELHRTLDLELVEIYQRIEAASADPGMAKMLEIAVGEPLLVTRRALTHKRGNGATMLFETYFRADRYYYTVQIDKRSAKSAKDRATRSQGAASRPRHTTSMRTR
jgi:GntR family transcriptional regulator